MRPLHFDIEISMRDDMVLRFNGMIPLHTANRSEDLGIANYL